MAKKFSNTYLVGIFACCRELFSATKHCGYFGGTKQEAVTHFKKIVSAEVDLRRVEASKKEEIVRKINELKAEKLEQIEANEEKKQESKCK